MPELVNWSCEKSYIDICCVHLTVLVDFLWMTLSIMWDVSFCETCTITKLFCWHQALLSIRSFLTGHWILSLPGLYLKISEHGSSCMQHL